MFYFIFFPIPGPRPFSIYSHVLNLRKALHRMCALIKVYSGHISPITIRFLPFKVHTEYIQEHINVAAKARSEGLKTICSSFFLGSSEKLHSE